ncbi:MAG TPA: hypothetical protein VF790_08845, partial [Dissulfurispiraceae bacterium]
RQWKGNARELQNEIKRAVIFSKDDSLTQENFSNSGSFAPAPEGSPEMYGLDYKEARKKVLEEFNVHYITSLLRRTEGKVSLAAQLAGVERQSLQQLMRKYGILSGVFRKDTEKS